MVVAHGETDIGRRRKVNEDTIFAARGLYLVCDGMGGHQAGEVASRLSVEAIANFIERSEADRELTWPFGFDPRGSFGVNRLRTAVKLANRTVFEHASSTEAYTGMGTTVAAVLIGAGEPRLTCASVGDSRVYRLRAGALAQLTRDDSWANLLAGEGVREGAGAGGGLKNVLTKALGAREEVELDVVDHPLTDGDTVLLCSDGLTNMVPDPRIAEIVTGHAADVAAACRALVTEANDRGGRDNVSVILVQYRH
ncbi:MAG: protein phosphatase 2C domain-containing protein [Candidatus Rokuibacteriota bacterium]